MALRICCLGFWGFEALGCGAVGAGGYSSNVEVTGTQNWSLIVGEFKSGSIDANGVVLNYAGFVSTYEVTSTKQKCVKYKYKNRLSLSILLSLSLSLSHTHTHTHTGLAIWLMFSTYRALAVFHWPHCK